MGAGQGFLSLLSALSETKPFILNQLVISVLFSQSSIFLNGMYFSFLSVMLVHGPCTIEPTMCH